MNRRRLISTLTTGACAILVMGISPDRANAKAKASTDTYLHMNPATGVIPRRDGRRSTLTIEVGLEISDTDLRQRATLSKPRLTAAYNEIIRTAASHQKPHSPPNLELITRDLQAATDQVLGRAGARILLGTVIIN